MKYSVIIFAFCFLLFSFRLAAADTWIKTYDPFGDVDYFPEDIVVCQDGGYAVNGYYNYYDPEYGIDEDWGFLIKTDSDGNLLWTRRDTLSFMSSNRSYAFVETSDSGFMSGISSGTLIKRDYNGHREWAIDEDFAIHSMCNTDDGNIILGGFQNFNIGLRKIDENGNTLWTKVYQIDDDYSICKSIIQTQDGGYALTGYLDYINPQTGDILVMKTDENGDSLWTRTYDGYGSWDVGNSITETDDERLIIAGQVDTPSLEALIWMLTNQGSTVWVKQILNSFQHWSIISINNNSHVTFCISENGAKIYNFDNNFTINWENVLPGWPAYGDRSFNVIVGYGYVCALHNVGGIYEDNIGIAKTDSLGQVFAIDEYEIPHTHEITLSNYPNPFNQETTISFNLDKSTRVTLDIFNIKGQKVKPLINDFIIKGEHTLQWDGTNTNGYPVSPGVYFIKFKADKNEMIRKLVIIR